MTDSFSLVSIALFLVAALRATTPLLLAAIGGALSARVSVFNIGLEGMMLSGAFAGFYVSDKTGSALTGLVAAALAGGVVATVFAIGVVVFEADEVVVGITVNLAVIGLTATLLRVVYGSQGSYQSPDAGQIGSFGEGWWSGLPLLGRLIEGVDYVMVLAGVIAVAAHLFLTRTRRGLRMRAIGSNPDAAVAAGLRVRPAIATILVVGGCTAGMGGAYLSLSGLSLFSADMAAGLGYVALAAVLFGAGRPLRVTAACLLFGAMTAAGFRLQNLDLPSEFVLATPYLTTIVVLALAAWRGKLRSSRHSVGKNAALTPEVAH